MSESAYQHCILLACIVHVSPVSKQQHDQCCCMCSLYAAVCCMLPTCLQASLPSTLPRLRCVLVAVGSGLLLELPFCEQHWGQTKASTCCSKLPNALHMLGAGRGTLSFDPQEPSSRKRSCAKVLIELRLKGTLQPCKKG